MAPELQPNPTGQDPAASSGQDPQAGGTGPTTGQDPAQPTGQDPAGTTLSPEAMAAELARARKEAADFRTRAQALEAEKAQREKADMTELERAKTEAEENRKRAEAAEAAVTERGIRDEVTQAARTAGFADPEDAYLILGASGVPKTDDGKVNVKELDQALHALIERKPHLAGQAASTTSPANGARGNGRGQALDMNQLLRAAATGE